MYHRFEENKYPSTNIKIEDFKSHISLIKKLNFKFISYEEFNKYIDTKDNTKKVLLTIDDGFSSFYRNAWPILKKEKIPFIIFINTESIGSSGYMNWKELKEISEFDFVHKKIVENLGFVYGFGQHSGVIDTTKDKFELPRFPINEKYGEIKRFKRLLKTIPFPYKKIIPEERYLNQQNNPPDVRIIFFRDGPNIKNINCYSNEGNEWRKSKIEFVSDNELKIILEGKFTTERGRINCSLREDADKWRWLGIQFVISDL